MLKLIPLDKKYEFALLEEDLKIKHPVSNYYTKISDLSINLIISLKWIKWGFMFMKSISDNLTYIDYPSEIFLINTIQKNIKLGKEEKHEILIDNLIVETEENLEKLIENFYNNKIFNDNTKIHVKLKLNLREFLVINNCLFPTLLEKK